ncbi:6-phosphogluconolactonase [Desulfuromonas thiophila]|uniref:6-phosphogluconolactonase n=1 Tax=Desulfuromonas thiophila TaxID=57664 RepID=UPI0029F588BC|nr:6-phosphogluconolactonase [Desulfuromonas thiophila]
MADRQFDSPDVLARSLASFLVRLARRCVRQRGRFSLVLSGGGTPLPLYRLLGQEPWRSQMPWAHTWLLQGDERAVPPHDNRSNWALIRATFGDLPLADEHWLRMRGELGALAGARDYQLRLHVWAGGIDLPRFDLVLLGMGEDGHVASLFPGRPAAAVQGALVVAETAAIGQPPVPRISLALPLINAARYRCLLLTGSRKRLLWQQLQQRPTRLLQLPVSQLARPIFCYMSE